MGGTAFRQHRCLPSDNTVTSSKGSPSHPCTLHSMWEKPVSAAKLTPGKNTSKFDKERKCKTFLLTQIRWFSELNNETTIERIF